MSCDYASCRRPAVTEDRGYRFCREHYWDHLRLLREEAARSCPCGQQFVSTNPKRLLCDVCRKSGRRAS